MSDVIGYEAGAIVLAAGPSSRLGRPKQLLRLEDQSLVRRAALAAIDGGCHPVVVVTGAQATAVSSELSGVKAIVTFNPRWSMGMGASLRAGLSGLLAAEPLAAAVVVLMCDQPHLSAQIIQQLLIARKTGGLPMAACEYEGTIGPPCCFDRSMFTALSKIGDAHGAKQLLMRDPKLVARVPWPLGALDIDTPEHLKQMPQLRG